MGIRAGLTYAYSAIDTKRKVDLERFSDNLKSNYDAHSLQGFGEAAYRFGDEGTKIEPYANLTIAAVMRGGFFVSFVFLSNNIMAVDDLTFVSAIAAAAAVVVSQVVFIFYKRQGKALFN